MSDLDVVNGKCTNQEAIEILEDILTDAKEGAIVSIAVAFVRYDRKSGNAFTGSYPMNLLGEISCLNREILDACIDTRLHQAGKEY